MYLSCVELNPHAAETYRLVASPYRMHAAVEAACDRGAATEAGNEIGRVLWRLDDSDATGEVRLFIVSPDLPIEAELCSRLHVDASAIRTKDYTPRLEELAEGQLWAFRLKANPVRKVLCDKGLEPRPDVIGTLQGAVTMSQQIEWLLKRSAANGFEVVPNDEGEPQLVVSQRRKEKFLRNHKTVTLVTARYDGILRVTDAGAFRKALVSGIGRAKGFGCGLLTVARP